MKNSWTVPKVKSFPLETGKEWYVWFRFNNLPKFVKTGLKQIPDYNKRLEEANALAEVLLEKLQKGWVPDNSNRTISKSCKVIEAINYGIDQKKLSVSKNTADNFQSTVNFFCEAIKKLKFDKMMVANFDRSHAKAILEFLKKEKGWTNKNYNKHLGYLRSIFHEVLEADYTTKNPFNDIRNLKVEKTFSNIPPTDEEMRLICDQLQSKNYGFYIFYMLIYYCGIRPDELRNMKVKNLNFNERMIHLDAEFTKTSKNRAVPMLGNTYDLLKYYKDCDPEYYVFGTWVPNGGRHSHRNWFLPNPYQIKEDTPNKQWNQLIKKELEINKSLYSGKHKGADDKFAAGMDIKTICDIFGHSETQMTERYMHSLKSIRFEAAKKVKLKTF
ncbi:site-specific integrase [Chryseobacterium sp. NEB161]|nr:site-specific integrase [Chryseobacterium sp. NEB161]